MAAMGARGARAAWSSASRRPHARGGPAAVRAEGVGRGDRAVRELLDAGAPGLHFYTLNRSTATREIHDALFAADRARGLSSPESASANRRRMAPWLTKSQ